VNSLFFQLPAETQSLSKQVSIQVLAAPTVGSNIYAAALTNLECQVESDRHVLPILTHDLIEACTDAVRLLADQNIDVLKPKKTPHQRGHAADEEEVKSGVTLSDQEVTLKKKTLFRSTHSIHYVTHCLLALAQTQSSSA